MEKAIENAVKLLAEKITINVKSEDALRYTQAALNLEHALEVKESIVRQKLNLQHMLEAKATMEKKK